MIFSMVALVIFSSCYVQSSEQHTSQKQVVFQVFSTTGQRLAVCSESAVVQKKRIHLDVGDSTYKIYGKLTKVLYLKIAHFFQPGSSEWMTLCLGIPLNKTLAENIALHSAWYIHGSLAQGNADVLCDFFKRFDRAALGYNRALMVHALKFTVEKLFVKKSRPDSTGCLWWNPLCCLLIDEPHIVSEVVAHKSAITSPQCGMAFLYAGFYFVRYHNKKVYNFPSTVEFFLPTSLQRSLFLKRLAPLVRCCCLSGPVWCCMVPMTAYITFMLYTIFSNLV